MPAGSWDTYVPGSWCNQESLPVDYELVGLLLEPVKVGYSVRIYRLERNGVRQEGVFASTPVVAVFPGGFHTTNSVYRLELYSRENSSLEPEEDIQRIPFGSASSTSSLAAGPEIPESLPDELQPRGNTNLSTNLRKPIQPT